MSGIPFERDAGAPPYNSADGSGLRAGAPKSGVIGRYDHVTRLPNRVQFLETLGDALSGMWRDGQPRTLVLVTIAEAYHFNQILRALGHAFSEDFIREGARRVATSLPLGTPLFNVSVLSFAFILVDRQAGSAEAIAKAIDGRFAAPLAINDIPIQSRAGVGLVRLDSDAADAAETLRSALTAAQDSRRTNATFAYYNPHSDAAHQRAFRLLTDFPRALRAEDQLMLYFQPRVALATHRCRRAEALIRWHHPELGWISPGEFVPLVETTALIEPLTKFVVETGLRQLREWRAAGADIGLSLNVAPQNVASPDFCADLESRMSRYGVAPADLELEFTEGRVSPDQTTTLANLRALRARGMTVAIDDFGSGYSNMAYLARFPADVVKIDKSFVMNMDDRPHDRFLVEQITRLATGLGFAVVAEGVESADSYRHLAKIGCSEAQGFYLSRPVSADSFAPWADRQPAVTRSAAYGVRDERNRDSGCR